MAKSRKWTDPNLPVWFDGTNINEAVFCDEFLSSHKIIYSNRAFFTPDGRVTDDLPLRGEIFEWLKCCAVNNIPRKVSNILEVMKLAAQVDDFPPLSDRIHLSNGTLMTRLTKQKEKLEGLLSGISPFNAKSRAEEIGRLLDGYIPAVEKMQTLLTKYNVAFTQTAAENKRLKKKNSQLAESLEAAQEKSVLKKLQDSQLRRDYEAAISTLERIPPEVLDWYTQGDHARKERPIEEVL